MELKNVNCNFKTQLIRLQYMLLGRFFHYSQRMKKLKPRLKAQFVANIFFEPLTGYHFES